MKDKNKVGMMMAVMMGKKPAKMAAPKMGKAPKAVYKKTTVKKMK